MLFRSTSRGPIVDEAALIEALTTKRIAKAGLDVFDEEPLPKVHPLRKIPNTVLTPHTGFTVEEGLRKYYTDAIGLIADWRAGKPRHVYDGFKD